MKPKLYIAGPMTGVENFLQIFADARDSLIALGYTVESPGDNEDTDKAYTWSDYMKLGLRQMLTCDALAMLPGWINSKGATMERRIALELGMEVRELGEWQ